MSTEKQLPERPNLDQLKKQARERARARGVQLAEAQFELAQEYGFASWTKLKAHVEMVTALTRLPDEVGDHDFLALVCLTYGDGDAPGRIARGVAMLLDDPVLGDRDPWSRAATGRLREVDDPAAQGGPFAWEPLLYLCYSRVPMTEADALTTATALLDAGADPNAGYLWHGLGTPITALTGVLGGGEANQRPHDHWNPLARLLLERGADPNDGQALYNRQFAASNEHLELLFEFGLGRGDGGPWHERLSGHLPSPAQMVHHQLRWAIHHGLLARVRVLADNGADLEAPFDLEPAWATQAAGRTPAEFAALCGQPDILDELVRRGVPRPTLAPVDGFVGAILAGADVERIVGSHPDAARQAREQRPSLVVQAAATGRKSAVMNAVTHGFDINALGRADAPTEESWQTALHTAVERDDIEMVRWLLQLGADPSVEDARFHATPLGWAEHFGRTEIAALLTN